MVVQLFSNTLPNPLSLTWSITSRDGIRMKGAPGGHAKYYWIYHYVLLMQ